MRESLVREGEGDIKIRNKIIIYQEIYRPTKESLRQLLSSGRFWKSILHCTCTNAEGDLECLASAPNDGAEVDNKVQFILCGL